MTSPLGFDACIFDLDGAVVQTAPLRKAAWKTTLDAFLESIASRAGRKIRPFDIRRDYKDHFDGKLRRHGIATFLRSRQIEVAEGAPTDSPEVATLHALHRRKREALAATRRARPRRKARTS